MRKWNIHLIDLLILAGVTLIAAIVLTHGDAAPAASRPTSQQSIRNVIEAPPTTGVPPACPTLRPDPSFGVSLIDTQTGQPLCEHNPDGIAQPASTTKVMAALLTAKYLQARRLSLDTLITVQPIDKQVEWDAAVAYLQAGHSYSVRVLLYMASILSAADAVMVLARFVAGSRQGFLALMNDQARLLGMRHTHYTSPYGYASTPPDHWQQGEQASVGNYSSAHDMALMMAAFAKYPDVVTIFGASAYHQGGIWLSRSSGYVITDSWIGLSTAAGERGKNLHLPFQVLAVKKGCMWCGESYHKLSYVMLVRFQQAVVAAAFLYTTQNYSAPSVGDMLATLLWAFHQCDQPAYSGYCQ
jgi:D-alanyl-D-alanine carboxypeptidase